MQEAGCGICSELGDPEALAAAIVRFIELPVEDRNKMRTAAVDYSTKHFSKKTLMDRMDEELQR